MAYIDIVYRVYRCERQCPSFNPYHCGGECAREWALEDGCLYYDDGVTEDDDLYIPFGDCANMQIYYGYKGLTVKKYELIPDTGTAYEPDDIMKLLTSEGEFECLKVTLDGKRIFTSRFYEEDEQDGNDE